ncbi:MAG TPA: STAS domain-containing protein [Micromonospora sp.]
MSLAVHTEQRGDVTVVSVAGDLDVATAPMLETRLSELLDQGACRLVLDLADVSFCDSAGLSLFVRAREHCRDAGGRLQLAAPARTVRRVLEVSGLAGVLEISPTVDAAVAAGRHSGE